MTMGPPDQSAGAPDLSMTQGNPDLSDADLATNPVTPLKHESRSSAIAISDDDKLVAAVSPDDDTLFLIDTTKNNSTNPVKLTSGCEPRSVVYAPDVSFWVACRGNGTALKVSDLDKASPTVGTPITVGAEPTAIAVSPHGKFVLVANYADGTVNLFDNNGDGSVTLAVGPNPRALAVTNGGGSDDTKETAFVTLMFGQPIGGNVASEGNDTGRQGVVIPISLATSGAGAPINLAPIADTGFKVNNKANQPVVVGAYPNQLQAIALHNGNGYVPSTAASPAGPVNNAGNIHPFVSVFDASKMSERPFAPSGSNPNTRCGTNIAASTAGYGAGTLDLAVQVRDLNGQTQPPPVLFPTIPVDIAFVPQANIDIAYVVSEASDEVVRVAWEYANNTACLGAPNAMTINLQAMAGDVKVPIGIAVRNDATLAYVNSWAGREVEVIDFSSQTVSARVPLSPAANDPVNAGKKLFWTSTGRWSKAGWGSCGACHPDGLSDNVTFVFNTGPRQTLPLDAVYGKPNGVPDPTDQRVLNWSAIFDEVHDFENNTRGVSGGLGAIVSVNKNPIDLTATKDLNLLGSVKQLAADGATPRQTVNAGPVETVDTTVASAWDKIDAYVQTLRSSHKPSGLDGNMVAAGHTLFQNAKCAECHGGVKWTVSRRSFTPAQGAGTGSPACVMQTTMLAKKSVPTGNVAKPQNNDAFQLETEHTKQACTLATQATDCAAFPPATCNASTLLCVIAPQRLTCAVRAVGTFGAGAQGTAFEVRSDTDGNGNPLLAEGAAGFNPPSLLSLAATAPYLHNGAAPTLEDLFTDVAFKTHWEAGNPNFAPTSDDAKNLAAYLRSIDPSTSPEALDPNFDLCQGSFVANNNAVCTNP
jgi:DNA-binding beta-propeller fold protein YncE